jgi:hypothetical protein
MKKKLLLILFAAVSFTNTLFAYDVVGHRIVAEIAYQNLSGKARKQVDKALGKRGIVYASSWADEIKSDKSYDYSYAWHYQNLKPSMDDGYLQHMIDNPSEDGEHLFLALKNMAARLKKDRNDQEALKYLVHLVGDLHQPLHLGHAEDLGGNKVIFQWFGKPMNIHQIWDGQLIDSRRMSSSEYAQYLEDKFEKQKREFKKYTLLESVKASYLIAESIYAYDMSDINSYHYIYHFMDKVDTMLYRGGIQLANILNDIYK